MNLIVILPKALYRKNDNTVLSQSNANGRPKKNLIFLRGVGAIVRGNENRALALGTGMDAILNIGD